LHNNMSGVDPSVTEDQVQYVLELYKATKTAGM